MTRIGMNPARRRYSSYRPARVTLAVLVYLPHMQGYFEHRLDVIKLSLATLLKHTQEEHDLLVFDNGSCEEVKRYLRDLFETGSIRYLVTSAENVGKLGALRIIAGAAPGELIAYADDDTFFHPGWLTAHLEVYDAFPDVGMVSGSPERSLFDHGISSVLNRAESDADISLQRTKVIPEEWEREWAVALGKDVDVYLNEVEKMDEILLEKDGLEAFGTACHNQFLAPRSVLLPLLESEWSGRLMGGLNELDNAIDEAGYLRLTTRERTTKLIGNVITPGIAADAEIFGIHVDRADWFDRVSPDIPLKRRILRWKPIRWFLQGVYNRLFWALTEQAGGWIGPEDGNERG